MKRTQTLFAAVLALALLFALAVPASAAYDYEANAKIISSDYSGKTIILHSNDVHGVLDGYAYMAQVKARLEAQGADVILADAGDFCQGTVYVSTTRGASAVTMMNEVGYDVVTLGNHEFDYGDARLIKNLERAQFKVICADVYQNQTGEPLFDPSVLIETEHGLKLGFFGMETPETATKVNPSITKDVSFATFDDFYASAQLAVDGLKEQGADLIFGLVHLGVDDESAENGYRSIDLYHKVSGIDFLIDGHSHTVMTAGENGEPIQSAGTAFAYIGVIIIDNETKQIEDHFLMQTKGMQQETLAYATSQAIIRTIDAEFGKVFATSEVFLNGEREPGNRTEETNMGSLITKAYYDAPVVGVTNGGGIRASVGPGEVTMRDINTVLPFGSTVAVVCVTGRELLEALEASTYCTPQAIGGFPRPAGWNGRWIPPFRMIRESFTCSATRRAAITPRPPSGASRFRP